MLILPIYWKQSSSKTVLLSMNQYRNWHYHTSNKVKQWFHDLVKDQISNLTPITGTFTIELNLYYKNSNCDSSNVCSIIEKFTLDALQEFNIITNDNVKYHLGSCYKVAGQDKINPRCEVVLKNI